MSQVLKVPGIINKMAMFIRVTRFLKLSLTAVLKESNGEYVGPNVLHII